VISMGIKFTELMRAFYFAVTGFAMLNCIKSVFGYTFVGCASNWWVWEFRPLWIIPTVLLFGLMIVIIKPEELKR